MLRQAFDRDPAAQIVTEVRGEEALLKAGALQKAIFNSANFSSIATDAKGVIQIFNVGAERMLGYAAAEVMNKITPADISDPQEVIARAEELSVELGTEITPGFEALVFKASRGIEDIYELTYIRKDGSRFPALVSVTALRDAQDAIIGYLLIGTDNTARKQAEEALLKAGALQSAIFNSANFSCIATDAKGVIQIFNVGAERMLGYEAAEVMNKITPADISDPQEIIERAEELSVELGTKIAPGFEALVFKASRGIEDIYELTKIRKDGSRFPALVSVTALRDAQNAIIGYLLIGTDNTVRKQIEAEQKQLSQRLRDHERIVLQKEQLRALAERLQWVREEDRKRVARDLHDQIGQILTAIKMDMTWMARHLPESEVEVRARLAESIQSVNDGVKSVRTICSGLRPGVLDDLGLAAAIEWQASDFASRNGVSCQVSVPAIDLHLDGDRATAAFRIFQECLTNVIRHAQAKSVHVSLCQEDENILLVVRDDGIGFHESDLLNPLGSLGLLGMKERAQFCGGEVQISSSPGNGTTVTVRVPVDTPGAERELPAHSHSG
jgi:PAS domain S-box-containing protein